MIDRKDLAYYRLRQHAELRAADAAACPASADIHRRLAAHYSDRMWALERAGASDRNGRAIEAPDFARNAAKDKQSRTSGQSAST